MKLLAWCLLPLLAFPALAEPARIFLIRHAEKPEDRSDPHLTAAGRERAHRWVSYFTNSPTRQPTIVLAARATKGHPSVRPVETLEPLAQALHLEIQTPFASSDYEKLAHRLLTAPEFNGRTVAICWVHQSIPQLVASLGIRPEPGPWKDSDFSGVYQITFENGKPRLAVTHTE